MIAPWSFMNTIAVFIVIVLLVYLIWTTRKAGWRLRLLAILLAVPAIVGISYGLVNGSIIEPLDWCWGHSNALGCAALLEHADLISGRLAPLQ